MEETLNTNAPVISIGINRLLFEKRLSLHLSRKEASKKLGISKFYLTIIERGYHKLNPKLKEAFKSAYGVDDNFFIESLEYPVVINEKVYSPYHPNKWFDKAANSKSFKLTTGILSLVFIAMMIVGICINPRINGSIPGYFSSTSKNYQSYIVNNGTEGSKTDSLSEFSLLVPDKCYYVSGEGKGTVTYDRLRFYVFEKQSNLPFFFFNGLFTYENEGNTYQILIEERFTGNRKQRSHLYLVQKVDEKIVPIVRMVTDVKKPKGTSDIEYKYVNIYDLNLGGSSAELIKEGSEKYRYYTGLFETYYPIFEDDLDTLFTPEISGESLSYKQFYEDYDPGVSTYTNMSTTARSLGIAGIFLSIICIALFVFAFIEKHSIKRGAINFEKEEKLEREVALVTEIKTNEKETLPHNSWRNLYVPEFVMRALLLTLLFISSIATFIIFKNVLKLDSAGITISLGVKEVLSNLSVVATMIVYFVKLDIYQNKKDSKALTIFLFFGGLLYYLVLVFIYYGLGAFSSSVASVGQAILDYLPGNFIWGILVFNLFTLLLFMPPKFKNPTKNKVLLMRLSSIIPFSYLIASSIIYIGIDALGWQMPYAVSSFFFSKAPMITVFAFCYTLAVFFYRRYAKKKYGEVNGAIYIKGNKYNYIRNFIGAGIIAAIGIFDLICLFVWPDNPLKFGTNYLMLIAVPFIIFYHPHLGKRNKAWDYTYDVLYAFVYIVGIILIVVAVLMILTTI